MRVFVYRNLNRKGVVWSLKDPKTGLVVDRVHNVHISKPVFKVSEAGRQRVLKNLRKNVHAGVVGKRIVKSPPGKWIRVTYNPYRCNYFITPDGKPIREAKYAKLTKNGCFAQI